MYVLLYRIIHSNLSIYQTMEFYINKKPIVCFVCHDNDSIQSVYHHIEQQDNAYIMVVGVNVLLDEMYAHNKKIMVAASFPDNIECEPQMISLSAWYAIIKNNLFKNRKYICMLEHDVVLKLGFFERINELCIEDAFPVVSFFSTTDNFMFDLKKTVFENFLIKKKLAEYPIHSVWNPTRNHCMQRNLMAEFIEWYYPDCLQIKKEDETKFAFYHERLFSVFLYNKNIQFHYMYDMVRHYEARSHIKIPADFNWQMYIKLNTGAVHPITKQPLETQDDVIKHYKTYGYFDKLPYKEKKYGLLYDDETGVYSEYIQQLKTSMENYGGLEVIVYKKSEINEKFREKYSAILNEQRGCGYWLWKPYIIGDTLKKIEEGATLFYMDNMYYFNEKFDVLYEDIDKTTIKVWDNKPNQPNYMMHNWCKIDVLKKYNMLNDANKVVACWAGALLMKNCYKTKNLINTWLAMCCNYDNITDSPSKNPEPADFIEHHHDQSLLSIILHKNNCKLSHWDTRYLQNVRCPW